MLKLINITWGSLHEVKLLKWYICYHLLSGVTPCKKGSVHIWWPIWWSICDLSGDLAGHVSGDGAWVSCEGCSIWWRCLPKAASMTSSQADIYTNMKISTCSQIRFKIQTNTFQNVDKYSLVKMSLQGRQLNIIPKPICIARTAFHAEGRSQKTLPEAQRTQKLTPRLGLNMAPLALIANLATRWRHFTFSHLITFSH